MAAPKFKSDIPSEDWLREKLRWTQEDGRNQWGVPKTFGPITGSFDRQQHLHVEVLLARCCARSRQRLGWTQTTSGPNGNKQEW